MPMPVLTVEFAPGDNWNVASPTWVNITAEVRNTPGFRIRRGRQTPFTRMRPSTLTLTLDNSTGNFDPDNSSGAYANDLVPMVPIRVRATHNAVTYDLYRGFVTSWTVGQKDFSDTFTTVQAVDGLSLLQLYTLPSLWVQEVQADSPIVWYRMGEQSGTVAVDASGNKSDGVYRGGLTFGAANSAILNDTNTAVTFDGAGDMAECNDAAIFTADPFSIEFWFKTSTDFSSTGLGYMVFQGLIQGGFLKADDGYFYAILHSNNKLVWAGKTNGGDVWGGLSSSSTVNDGEWHHTVLTVSDAGDIEAYLDGASMATDTQALTMNVTAARLGNTHFGGTTDYTGELDEVLYYNTELSSTRVAAHYNAATAPWASELTSARVANILDAVGWPAADRSLSTGLSTMQNFLGGGGAALGSIFLAQDTEDSEVWIAGDGKVRFANRHDRNTGAYAATFSNDASDTVYRDFKWVSDEQLLRNVAEVTDSESVVTESRNDSSVSRFAPRTVARTSNTADSVEMANYADWLAGEFGGTRSRGLLTLLNASNGTNDSWAEMLSRELGDLISVENTPVSGGAQNQYDFFVEEINLRGTVEAWTMTLGLSPGKRQRMFVLDDGVLGKLDRATQGLLGW